MGCRLSFIHSGACRLAGCVVRKSLCSVRGLAVAVRHREFQAARDPGNWRAAQAWLALRCPDEWLPAGQRVRELEARVLELEARVLELEARVLELEQELAGGQWAWARGLRWW